MDDTIQGYKLVRRLKDGQLYPLFINKRTPFVLGVWLTAEDHPTPGYAHRPGWHATLRPYAPHLRESPASGPKREWVRVLLRGTTMYDRPESQGGAWVLAKEMMILDPCTV